MNDWIKRKRLSLTPDFLKNNCCTFKILFLLHYWLKCCPSLLINQAPDTSGQKVPIKSINHSGRLPFCPSRLIEIPGHLDSLWRCTTTRQCNEGLSRFLCAKPVSKKMLNIYIGRGCLLLLFIGLEWWWWWWWFFVISNDTELSMIRDVSTVLFVIGWSVGHRLFRPCFLIDWSKVNRSVTSPSL